MKQPAALPIGKKTYPKLGAIVKAAILDAYTRHDGNIYTMAIELGIGRVTIYRHLRTYGVTRPRAKFERRRTGVNKKTPTASRAG